MTISSDPEQRVKQIAAIQPPPNPAGEGNTRTLKHGAWSERYLSPLVEEKETELLSLLEEASYIANVDRIIVRNLARTLARLERFDWYLDQEGDVVITGNKTKLNPVISAYFTALESCRRHCEALGLTPGARAKLGVDLMRYKDVAERMAERTQDDNR